METKKKMIKPYRHVQTSGQSYSMDDSLIHRLTLDAITHLSAQMYELAILLEECFLNKKGTPKTNITEPYDEHKLAIGSDVCPECGKKLEEVTPPGVKYNVWRCPDGHSLSKPYTPPFGHVCMYRGCNKIGMNIEKFGLETIWYCDKHKP
jgi:hypothetical protein